MHFQEKHTTFAHASTRTHMHIVLTKDKFVLAETTWRARQMFQSIGSKYVSTVILATTCTSNLYHCIKSLKLPTKVDQQAQATPWLAW